MQKAKLIILIIILIAVGIGAYYLFGNYSSGYRAGTMVKFSRKGNVIKTYEGQLNLGMVLNDTPNQSPTQVNNIWSFTVRASDTAAIRKIDEAMLTGKRVKVHYNEKFVHMFWRGDTKYFVDEAVVLH
jgi:hypothetical protein